MAERRHNAISTFTRGAVAVIVVAAGAAVFHLLYATRPDPPTPVDALLGRDVQVMRPAMSTVHRQWTGFGAARALNSADVPAEVTAIVVEVPREIQAGARVRRGAVLARLDPADFERQRDLIGEQINSLDAELEQLDIEEASWREQLSLAEEEERLAASDLARVQALMESGDATELELDRAAGTLAAVRRSLSAIREEFDKAGPRRLRLRAQRQALVIEHQTAQRNLERTTITSPIEGTIQFVAVDLGEQVTPGRTVAAVVDLSSIELEIRLPASARLHLRVGDEAAIMPAGVPDRRWTGHVARIGPADDEATRTFPAYVEVNQDPSERGGLTPGLYVQASVSSSLEEERVIVPRRSIARGRVLLIEDGRVVPRGVEVAFYISGRFPELDVPEEEYWAALAEPLPAGATIILNGSMEIAPGALVRPIEGPTSAVRADGVEGANADSRGLP